ncbi:tetratricopeptide repeat protein [candidate division KSB1 bacterium]|nr:tetratricopeptide repeat protein [candidate division KSB1 bacterium]
MFRGNYSPKEWRWLALIAALFLAVRIIYLRQLLHSPLLNLLFLDSEFYLTWAKMLVTGQGNPPGPFWLSPGYPYFLAGLFAASGSKATGLVVIAQFLLSIGSCGLLILTADNLFGRRVALITGALAVFCAPWLYYDGVLLSASLILFLNSALIYVLVTRTNTVDREQEARPFGWILAGGLAGLSALTRPSVLLFAALLVAWLLRKRADLRRFALLFLAATCVTLAPALIRNWTVTGTPALTTSSGGVNFYIGNRYGASGAYDDLPFVYSADPIREAEAFRDEASRLAHDSLTLAEANRYWGRRALTEISRWPGPWVVLFVKKLWLVTQNAEIANNLSFRAVASYCPIVGALPLRWGLLFPLAVAGIFLAWPIWRRLALLWCYAAAYVLTCLIFFSASEYRFPLTLVLLLGAACFVAGLWQLIVEQNWKRLLLGAWVYLLMLAVANWPSSTVQRMTKPSMDFANMATIAVDRGMIADAVPLYARALASNDSLRDARVGLADCLWKLGSFDDARREYELAGVSAPDSLLGAPLQTFLEELDRYVLAQDDERAYAFVAERFPKSGDAPTEVWLARARIETRLRMFAEAVGSLLRAHEQEPESPELLHKAGVIAELSRNAPLADSLMHAAIKLYPAYAPARIAIAEAALSRHDTTAARQQLDELLRIRIRDDSVKAHVDDLARRLHIGPPTG